MKWVPSKVYDPQFMEHIGQSLSTTVDIAFSLSKGRTLTFLLAVGLVMFIWQQFLALLIGGAFYRLMAGVHPRVWTGVIVFFSIPPLVRISFMVYSTLSVTAVELRRLIRHRHGQGVDSDYSERDSDHSERNSDRSLSRSTQRRVMMVPTRRPISFRRQVGD